MKTIQLLAALAAMLFVSGVIAKSHDSANVKQDAYTAPVYEYII